MTKTLFCFCARAVGVWKAGIASIVLTASIANVFAQGAINPIGGPSAMMKSLDQIEPRTPISGSTGISAPGSYYLTQNIVVGSGHAIIISANNVKLDLNGFSIISTSAPPAYTAILLSGSLTNLSIFNGSIFGAVTNNGTSSYGGSGFANGIYFSGGQPLNARVSDVNVSGCTGWGIYLNTNFTGNSGNSVDACLVSDCGGGGIAAERVTDCSAASGTGVAINATTAVRCRGVSYGGYGVNAVYSVRDCVGLSTLTNGLRGSSVFASYGKTSGGGMGLLAFTADSSYGETAVNNGYGLWSRVANNCYGNCTAATGGYGLICVASASGCLGIKSGSSGYGLSGSIVNGCVGIGGGTNVVYNGSSKYNTP